jgi:hypothetical protein
MTAKKRGRKPKADVFNGAPMGAEYTPGGGNRFRDDLRRKFLPGTEPYLIFQYWRDAYRAAGGAFDADGRHKPGSAAAGEATTATVEKFPGHASSPKNRARAIENLVGNVARALAFVIPWQTLHAEPFHDAYNEAVVRLRLAKAVVAARPAPARRTDAGGVTGETATKLLKTPTLSKAEVALLEQPGAFKNGAPAALASELAGALLDMAAELQAGEARAKAAESAARDAEARAAQAEKRLENIKRDLETGDPGRSVITLRKSLKQHLPQ